MRMLQLQMISERSGSKQSLWQLPFGRDHVTWRTHQLNCCLLDMWIHFVGPSKNSRWSTSGRFSQRIDFSVRFSWNIWVNLLWKMGNDGFFLVLGENQTSSPNGGEKMVMNPVRLRETSPTKQTQVRESLKIIGKMRDFPLFWTCSPCESWGANPNWINLDPSFTQRVATLIFFSVEAPIVFGGRQTFDDSEIQPAVEVVKISLLFLFKGSRSF